MTQQKYQSAVGMRTALEERLNRMAKESAADIMRLRRHVAFDRFLGLPTVLPEPPEIWKKPFQTLAKQCGISADFAMTINSVRDYYKTVVGSNKPERIKL